MQSSPDHWGRYQRPTPWALDSIDWSREGFEPRWLGHESSDCAVSFDPSIFSGRGADEQRRFTEGLRGHSDLALVIFTAGRDNDTDSTVTNAFGGGDSIMTPLHGRVDCRRLPLGVKPTLTEGLDPADRDLALRLCNDPRVTRWWALDLQGMRFEHGGGGSSESPAPGRLTPLLEDQTGATLAGVAEVDGQRWYVLPRGADPIGVIRWLMQHALPAWAPGALRAARRSNALDEELQTPAERSLNVELAQLDATYANRRTALQLELSRETERAEAVREGLLYGRGRDLEDAIARVLRAAGLRVQALDALLGGTKSADLLVEQHGRRWLVEVKSANGAAKESLVGDLTRHQQTWPELRPDFPVHCGMLIVSHHLADPPNVRPLNIGGGVRSPVDVA